MNKEILKKVIREENRWWTNKFSFEDFKERKIYFEIKKFLNEKQIIALTGLRRVGKTSIMFKIIEDKIDKGFEKNRIFYFSFDEFSDIRIREVIELYEDIKGEDINKGKYLFLFDEIQKAENWQEQLKRIYDNFPNIKFVISGSESLFIRKKSKESLAGRIFEFKINPLTFKEYLLFRGKKFDNLFLYEKQILKEFKDFLLCSGFPEIIGKDKKVIIKYINEDIIGKIVDSDMPKVFDIKNTSEVRSIFNIIYNNPGQLIEIKELSNELGIDRNKVSNILEYLEQAFLIKKLYNFSKNARKTERKLKKYYPTIINPYLIDDEFSKIFENFMVLGLDAEYFWRDAYKNEVDIVKIIEKGGKRKIMAIEIKSGEIKNKHLKPIKKFLNQFKIKNAIILSYNTKKDFKEMKAIPFYEYILRNH